MLADEIPRVLHAGNDTLGPFPLSVGGTAITYSSRTQIVVTRFDADLVPTLQVEGVNYTLSADSVLPDVGQEEQPVAAASFSFENDQDPLAEGEFVLAERITVPTQDLIAALTGGLSSANLERTFDVVIRHIQEIKNQLDRVIILNRLEADGVLEIPLERANKIFGFDGDGNPIATTIDAELAGEDGREIELQKSATHIQWRYVGDVAWTNLVALADIEGPPGAGFGDMLAANNLSDLLSASAARTNLGLNTAALLAATAVFQVSNNLSEGNATSMRTNLGLSAIAIMAEATIAQFLAGTASKALTAEKVWDAAAMVALTDSGGSIAVDMGAGINFEITLDGDHAFAAPSNTKPGRSGVIYITQDASGNRVPTWHANYKWAGGTPGVLSTDPGAVDRVNYFIRSSTFIELQVGALDIA